MEREGWDPVGDCNACDFESILMKLKAIGSPI